MSAEQFEKVSSQHGCMQETQLVWSILDLLLCNVSL